MWSLSVLDQVLKGEGKKPVLPKNGFEGEAFVPLTVCSTHEYYKLWEAQPLRTKGSPSRANPVFWKDSFFSLTL